MDTTHSILKSAKSFFAGTLLSRLSGLFREIALAISFGSSPELAAFMVSYRLANLFRRLLGEGNLQAGFVPHFAFLKEEERGPFFRDVAYSMALLLFFVVVLLEGFLYILRQFVSPDWLQVIDLTMWMVPGLFFICLYGLNSALLQCHKKYFIPAVAPVAFNFIWIGAALLYADVTFLAIAITVGFAGQWFVTAFEGAPLLPFQEWFKPHLFSQHFRKLLKPLFLGIAGIGAVQFNSALDAIFARFADLRGPTFLWYAIRIQQLPIALFGIALSSALLPPLSRIQDPEKRRELLQTALHQGSSLMLICTFGIFALGAPGISLLYSHGAFTESDALETTRCLWAYGVGLVPTLFTLILANKCYAEKNYRTPTLASLLSVLANLALNALFVFAFDLGAVSIALATSLSTFLNAAFLSRGISHLAIWSSFFKMSVGCILAFLGVQILQVFMGPSPHLFFFQAAHLALQGALFLGILGGVSIPLKLDLLSLIGMRKIQRQTDS